MSDTVLREIGEALYGPRWQSDLARDLGVSDRTMRRWAAGGEAPRQGVYIDLWRILLERATLIDDLAERAKDAANRAAQ